MTRQRLILLGLVWLGLLAFAGFKWRAHEHNRAALSAAAAEYQRLHAQSEALRAEKKRNDSDLTQAEQQLAALTPPNLPPHVALSQAEIADWLKSVQRLRQLFAEQPGAAIPEMRLLTDDDWLRVGKAAKFGTEKERRAALAEVRSAAVGRFGGQLSEAVQAYAQAFPKEKPASVQMLAAYLKQPINADLLARYELQDPSGPKGFSPATWYVQNRAPVDLVYDTRFRIGATSQFQNVGTHAWIPDYMARYQLATQEYAKANSGQKPARSIDAIPFFNPPLDPEVAAALIQSEGPK